VARTLERNRSLGTEEAIAKAIQEGHGAVVTVIAEELTPVPPLYTLLELMEPPA
jgi:hypothetical protein